MNVTFRQLKVFEAVARHLSYTRAAQELHLTQPAVSMQIKQLEESAGLPMFEQLGKKVYLTEAGKEMYSYSRNIAAQLSEAEDVLEQLKGVRRGHLDISVATTANYFATRLLAAFVSEFPDVTFSLDVTNRASLLRQLDMNEKDLVIMGRPPDEMNLDTDMFMENPLVVIASANHPLAKKRKLELAELANESFVIREQASGTRIAIQRFFTEQGIEFKTSMEMTSNEAIKQSVEAGLGLGIVSVHTLELELETRRLAVLDVKQFPILRHWYLVHRHAKRLSPVAEAFREFVMENADNFITRPEL
ncbi:RuBisCO operon transcriptional regulator CbbR [hydrothermal vent metagenome]|uniref:RuBisCO operon transcriptional regulator CbbR n=1 Tax=hydrothermal vent metagenome TaxID=652676 RepID=A0A3B1AQ58_9ZZZZ